MITDIEQIQDILSNNTDLSLIDQIEIRKGSSKLVTIALGLELFIPPRNSHTLYPQLTAIMEDYYSCFKPYLDVCTSPKSGKKIRTGKKYEEKLRETLANFDMETIYVFHILQKYPDPMKADFMTTSWQAQVFGRPLDKDGSIQLNSLNAFMPVTDEDGKPRFETLLDLTKKWCNMVQPIHGNAGFSLAPNLTTTDVEVFYPILNRYPGIDYSDSIRFQVAVGQTINRIKGINWLTVLSDLLVEELGGIEYCRRELEPECRIEVYNDGIIIIAGTIPKFGDCSKNYIPQGYLKVAQFTKPIRFTDYRRGFLGICDKHGNPLKEKLTDWINRFD